MHRLVFVVLSFLLVSCGVREEREVRSTDTDCSCQTDSCNGCPLGTKPRVYTTCEPVSNPKADDPEPEPEPTPDPIPEPEPIPDPTPSEQKAIVIHVTQNQNSNNNTSIDGSTTVYAENKEYKCWPKHPKTPACHPFQKHCRARRVPTQQPYTVEFHTEESVLQCIEQENTSYSQ